MSSRAISLAIFQPKSTSSSSRRLSFAPAINPAVATESSRNVVAGNRSTSTLTNSSAIAAKMDSALRCLSLPQHHHRFHIRPKIKQVFRRNLSRHDRVMDFVLIKKLQEPIELSDAH